MVKPLAAGLPISSGAADSIIVVPSERKRRVTSPDRQQLGSHPAPTKWRKMSRRSPR